MFERHCFRASPAHSALSLFDGDPACLKSLGPWLAVDRVFRTAHATAKPTVDHA
jgi:hypothetical protein